MTERSDVLERIRIREVLERYYYAHDYHRFDLLESCFTEDVKATYLNGAVKTSNRAELMESMRSPASFAFAHQSHNTSHTNIEIVGSTATSDTLVVIFFAQGKAGAQIVVRGARYLDKLRLENDEWRIYEREHRSLWQCQIPELALAFPSTSKS